MLVGGLSAAGFILNTVLNAAHNFCEVFDAENFIGSRGIDVWLTDFTYLSEGEKMTFLTEKFVPDWNQIETNENSILADFVSMYSFHPAMEGSECGYSETGFAQHIWNIIEAASVAFGNPYNADFVNLHLSTASHYSDMLSNHTKLRPEIDQYCFSSSSDIAFCKLMPVVKLYDHIEHFVDNPVTEDEYDLVRLHLVLLTLWDPSNTLPAHHLSSVESDIFGKGLQLIVNIVGEKDFTRMQHVVSLLPPYNWVESCVDENSDRCMVQTLHQQLALFVQSYSPPQHGGVTRKTVYAQIDYEEFLQQRTLDEILNIGRRGETALLEVADYLSDQIKCTTDSLGAAMFQELTGYFSSMHTFDAAKSDHDIAYIEGRLTLYRNKANQISRTVDSGVSKLIKGAVVTASANLAYQAAKLVVALARVANPFGWVTGSADPNDVLDALEEVSSAAIGFARAMKLSDLMNKANRQVQDIKRGLDKNAAFLDSVGYLIDNLDADDDDFHEKQETFLRLYGQYSPVITKPQLVEATTLIASIASTACEIITETEGPPIVVDIYKAYLGGTGACGSTARAIERMMETYSEIYDFQFDLVEEMARFMRAKTGQNAAENIGSSWTNAVQECGTFSASQIRHKYAMLAGISFTSYEIQKWQAIMEYCDVLEYENGGIRPSVCQGMDTDIPNLFAFIPTDCLGHQGFTRFYSIPALIEEEGVYKHATVPDDYARLNVTALLAGDEVHFQIPDSDWLVEHNFILEGEKDYAIYVRQFEVYLPVESTFPTVVTVKARSMAGNSIVPGGTTYTIKSSASLFSEYEEGHSVICRGNSQENPYNLCPSDTLPDICLAECEQTEFIPPSIYTQWYLQVNGYEGISQSFSRPATDMTVKVSMTLCKKSNEGYVVADEQEDEVALEDESLPTCCTGNEYVSSETVVCTSCPSGTVSALHGYFCEGTELDTLL